MDAVYKDVQSYETEKIHVAHYFHEYRKALMKIPGAFHKKKGRKKTVGPLDILGVLFTNRQMKELEEYCNISKLHVEGEDEPIPDVYMNGHLFINDSPVPSEEQCSLVTVKKLRERKGKSECRSHNRIFSKVATVHRSDLNPYQSVVVAVRVYEPFKSGNKGMLGKCYAEILLLGRQKLTDLRDSIRCPRDIEVPGDLSNEPSLVTGDKARDLYPSGFIFIEDVFYNDRRSSKSIDYSKEIRDWAVSKGIGPLKTASMATTRVDSLSVRFGHPYLYLHLGNCEHILIFSYARLIHPSDCLASEDYPVYIPVYSKQVKLCMMCVKLFARWVVTECDILPSQISYLCKQCFNSFLYVDGRKICNFKAYCYEDAFSVVS